MVVLRIVDGPIAKATLMAQALVAHQSPDSLSWLSLMLQRLLLSSEHASVLASIVLCFALADVEHIVQVVLAQAARVRVTTTTQPLADFATAPQRPFFDRSHHR